MNQRTAPTFTATPEGILLNGAPLAKSAAQRLSEPTRRYVERASELLKQVRPQDWESRAPHGFNDAPLLARVNMLLALASPQSLDKQGYNDNEQRVPKGSGRPSGDWTNEDGVTAADLKNPRFKGMDRTQIKKQKFVDANLDATDQVAQRLNVPPANILGLSAVESGWGLGSFILDGPTVGESTNGYFGMHAPAPFMDGTTQIGNGPSAMAGFSSYQDALNSFAARYGSMIQGVSDPTQFVTILQQQGKFGIKDGVYDPTYVPKVVGTINHLSSAIAYARQNPK